MLLAWVLAPTRVRAQSPEPARSAQPSEDRGDELEAIDGGECGEDETPEVEYVNCGADLPVAGRPALIGILGSSLDRIASNICLELLDDLYAREQCQVGSRECGTMVPLAVPTTAEITLASAPSAGLLRHDELPTAGSRLLGASSLDVRLPIRMVDPPYRPPRSHA